MSVRILTLVTVSTLTIAACGTEQGFNNGLGAPTPTGEQTEPTTPDEPDTTEPDPWMFSDSWDLSGRVPTDIIIFGDTSTSMTEELVTMGNNILEFTDRLSANNNSWHLAAVTGPTGCAVNGWMTETTPNFDALFSDAIVTKPADESQDEMGLQNVMHALDESRPGGCNEGFLRDDALLHVIFVSDENDESPGFEDPTYWQTYVDDMNALKGSGSLLRFSAVAGDVPAGCLGADPGFGYADVVDATGGEFLSICGDWPNNLDTLADASIIWDVFPLTREPDMSSIEVRVNQELVTTWVYEAQPNHIRFMSDPPATGDLVDIMYRTAQ